MKMPFGKYKGAELEDIPLDYLQWLAEEVQMTRTLAEEVDDQIALKERKGVVRPKDSF